MICDKGNIYIKPDMHNRIYMHITYIKKGEGILFLNANIYIYQMQIYIYICDGCGYHTCQTCQLGLPSKILS